MMNKDINDKEQVLIDDESIDSNQESTKPAWQQQKEEWYSHLNITLKQLDAIIGLCIVGLIIVAILIGIDAAGII